MTKLDGQSSFKFNSRGKIVGIKTPTVMREARSYYNCSDILFLPLEDEGGSGSAISHWERSQFNNEIMTASSVPNSKISVFTLALLEDSGWYSIDFMLKDDYTFLKNSKCNFNAPGSTCDTLLDQ